MILYVVTGVSISSGFQSFPPAVLPERDVAAHCWADWIVEEMKDPISIKQVRDIAESFVVDESMASLSWTLANGIVYELHHAVVPNVGLIYKKKGT